MKRETPVRCGRKDRMTGGQWITRHEPDKRPKDINPQYKGMYYLHKEGSLRRKKT